MAVFIIFLWSLILSSLLFFILNRIHGFVISHKPTGMINMTSSLWRHHRLSSQKMNQLLRWWKCPKLKIFPWIWSIQELQVIRWMIQWLMLQFIKILKQFLMKLMKKKSCSDKLQLSNPLLILWSSISVKKWSWNLKKIFKKNKKSKTKLSFFFWTGVSPFLTCPSQTSF